MWQIDKRPQFSKQYKLLGSERQKKVDAGILDLAYSVNPTEKGEFKKNMRVFAYELGRGDRIIYTVRYEDYTIVLLRVGPHKVVYGKD
ncbi:MAG: type II toxin-antitoxin system RelE family toxin [Nitrosotalea sp.]